ncbi:hypothetical protein VNO78_33725 [Psophocarpus tetragonolobus]|uniref:GDSL esterase/lipase n=1 Tax=Psophocarpus tetragonolobus TaxID=3891 RepID=A0AAN9NXI1_PSOTE
MRMMQIVIFLSMVFHNLVLPQICALPLAPALYVFGDSLVDSGNNNFLPTLARANYLPYGIDFPKGATGRFTNRKTVVDFIVLLIENLSEQFQRLYKLGARKIITFEIGPVGCIPSVSRKHPHQGGCVEETNQIVTYFNERLPPILNNLTSTLPGSTFVLGITDVSNPCCRTWENGTSGCIPLSKPCINRSKYMFWDTFHITETVYSVIASGCVSNSSACTPVTIQELVKM